MKENSAAMRHLCRAIRIGGAVFVFGVLSFYLFSWLQPPIPEHAHGVLVRMHMAGLPANALNGMPAGDRLLIAAISLPYLTVLVLAFWRLDCMLRGFERGEFFERETVGHLRAFSGFLLLAKVLSLAAMHARVAAMVHLLGHEKMRFLINLSSDDMAVLLMCALFFLIARMMEEGRRLAEENRGFV
jgi:hypothetical protein